MLAIVVKQGRGNKTSYVVMVGKEVIESYSIKDYPRHGMGGARDMAQTKARELNIQPVSRD